MANETIEWDSDFPLKDNPSYADAVMIMDKFTGKPGKVTVESLQAAAGNNVIGAASPTDSPSGTEVNGQSYRVSNAKAVPNPDDGSNDDNYTNFLDASSDPVVVPAKTSGFLIKTGGHWEYSEYVSGVDLEPYALNGGSEETMASMDTKKVNNSDVVADKTDLFPTGTELPDTYINPSGLNKSGIGWKAKTFAIDGTKGFLNISGFGITPTKGKYGVFRPSGTVFLMDTVEKTLPLVATDTELALTIETDIDTDDIYKDIRIVYGQQKPRLKEVNGLEVPETVDPADYYDKSEVDALLPNVETVDLGTDIFEPAMMYDGQNISTSDHVFHSVTGWKPVLFNVAPGKKYTIKNWYGSRSEFVGLNTNVVYGTKPSTYNGNVLTDTYLQAPKVDGKYTFIVPGGVYAVAFQAAAASDTPDTYSDLMIGEGDDVTPSETYVEKFNDKLIVSSILSDGTNTVRPSEIATKDDISDIAPKKINEIYFDGSQIWIRTSFNSIYDIVQRISLHQSANGGTNIRPVYLIGKAASITSAGILLNQMNDATPPLQYPNTDSVGLNDLGGNHGVSAIKVTGTHDKTSADIDSIWTDGTWEYYLISVIDSSNLLMLSLPQNIGGELVMSITNLKSTTLTHVSGATHTSSITSVVGSDAPQYPSIKNETVAVYIDGKKITDAGTYKGDLVDVVDEHEVVDPTTLVITNPMVWNNASTLATVKLTYRFFYNNVMQIDYSIVPVGVRTIRNFGMLQMYPLATSTGYPVVKAFMPGVNVSDYKVAGVDYSASSSSITHVFTSADLIDPDYIPNRMIQMLYDGSGNPQIGSAHGYNPLSGFGKGVIRALNVNGYWYVNGSNRKSYPWTYAGRQTDGTPIYATTYFSVFDPTINGLRADYFLHQSEDVKIYVLETKQAETNKFVKLADELIGKQIEVIEQSSGMTLSSDYVQKQGIMITASGAGEYLLLKLY